MINPNSGVFAIMIVVLFGLAACQTDKPAKEQTNPENGKKPTVFTVGDSPTKFFNDGKKLFANNCAQCHTPTNQKLVGPGLKGILERRKKDWIIAFIENSSRLIASGDQEAVALYNEYNKTQMQSYSFTPKEMQKLLFYMGNLGRKKLLPLDKLPNLRKE